MKTKLYVPENVEGKPNKEELEKAREIEKKLSEYRAFIGLALHGSVVSGYSNEGSDIDIYLFYDESKFGNPIESNRFFNDVMNLRRDFHNISLEPIGISLKSLEKPLAERGFDLSVDLVLSEMTHVVTGTKIDEYRKTIVEKIEDFSNEDKSRLAEALVRDLSNSDRASLKKRRKRLPELTDEEHNEILDKRKEMWRKRVQKIWGIGN